MRLSASLNLLLLPSIASVNGRLTTEQQKRLREPSATTTATKAKDENLFQKTTTTSTEIPSKNMVNTCPAPSTASTLDPYDMSLVHELVIDFTGTPNENNWDFALMETWICWQGINNPGWVPCLADGSISCAVEDGTIPDGLDPTYVTATITYDGIEDSGDETGVRYRGSSTFFQNINGFCGSPNLCECNCMEPIEYLGGTLPAGCKFPLALSLDKRIGGVERMDLNNLSFGSHIHDALTRSMLDGATPNNHRFSFVRVSIGPDTTGEFIDLGVYLNLEHLDSEFTERKTLSVNPFRYEGILRFDESPETNCDNLAGTYEPEGGPDGASCEESISTIRDVLSFIQSPGFEINTPEYVNSLDELVDVDNLLWHLAFFYLVGDSDGNQHEAFLDTFHSHVSDDGFISGRLEWVASDLDRSFSISEGLGLTGVSFHNTNEIIPALLQNEKMMLRLEHHIRYFLEKEFNEEAFECRGLALKDLLVPELGSYSDFLIGSYCPDEPLCK